MISQRKLKMLDMYFGFVLPCIRKTMADISLVDCYHVLQFVSARRSKELDDNDDDHGNDYGTDG